MVIEFFLEWVETAPVSKRVDAAGALVRAFLRNDISADERDDVEAAITTLTDDAAPSVRYEVAQTFGAHAAAPRHIISSLANDNLDISILVLSQSPVFHDAELASYAASGAEKQQIAIACRPWISAQLAHEICQRSCRDAAYALLLNPAAELNADDTHIIAVRFGCDTEIRNMLTSRNDLNAQTRLLLIEKLGNSLGGFMSKFDCIAPEKNDQIINEACDRASIIFAAKSHEEDVRQLVRDRITENRLTVAYLLRAACMGNITLIAHAFSELSGVGFARVETVLSKNRRSAFRAIYDRAGLPASAFHVFETAISAWRELLASHSRINQSRLPFLVTKQVLSACSAGENRVVDDLIVLLRKLSAEAARESAKSKAMEIANREALVENIQPQLLETDSAETIAVVDAEVAPNNGEETSADRVAASETTLDQELAEMETLLLEAADDVAFPDGPSEPVLVDAGYLGSLGEDDLDKMYADIYDISDVAFAGDVAKAA